MEAAEMAALAPIEEVSCAMVALPGVHSASGLESHVFSSLFVPPTSLTKDHTNRVSIDLSEIISAILFTVRLPESSTGEIPPLLMQNPAFGYRSLGYFSFISSTSPHIHTINLDHTWTLPEIGAYKAHLQSLGIRLDRHFIIILSDHGERCAVTPVNLDEGTATSIPSSPTRCRDFSPASFEFSNPYGEPGTTISATSHRFLMGYTSPRCGTHQDHNITSTPSSPSLTSPSPEPFSNFDLNNPALYSFNNFDPQMGITPQNTLLSGLDPIHSPSPTLNDLSHPQNTDIGLITGKPQLQILIDCPRFVEGLNISSAFCEAGITTEEEALAQCQKPCPGGLWGMVQNHRHTCAILERFGLSVSTPNSCIQFKAGLKLSTEDISTKYHTARFLSTCSWKGSPPLESDTDAHALYLRWQDVRAMFGAGGFCDQARGPQSDNLAEETERRAAALSQNDLNGLAAQLDPYL
ncbi:hypothetical protein B0H19DRAFT_1158286 [Mycena capillaripes]|nr:hypothetical protein B0H19DRAFT_1158286 [Mycena capillaripes]